MKSTIFLTLLGLAALCVAATAAIFSVTGIGMLFSGHFLEVSIMAGSLEFSKLMLASFLYRKWKILSKPLKFYQTGALITLMIITSAGIFGYLSDSYQKTKSTYIDTTNKIELYNTQINLLNDKKNRLINDKNSELLLRKSNLIRADSLTSRGIGINRTRQDILNSNKKINDYENNISFIEDSVAHLNSNVDSLKAVTLSGDLGPLIYLSNAFGMTMDNVVKYFILLLIFVFDPLAVSLVIATNMVIENNKKEKKKELENDKISNILEIEQESKQNEETLEIIPTQKIYDKKTKKETQSNKLKKQKKPKKSDLKKRLKEYRDKSRNYIKENKKKTNKTIKNKASGSTISEPSDESDKYTMETSPSIENKFNSKSGYRWKTSNFRE